MAAVSQTTFRNAFSWMKIYHYTDVTMSAMASQITSLTMIYSTVYSGAGQKEHQSSASLAFVQGIHRWPMNSPREWPVTRKIFPFDDVIMWISLISIKFVPKVPTSNTPALVQIMAWRQPGDKPLSEPMMVSLLTHICVTRPQWFNCWRWI